MNRLLNLIPHKKRIAGALLRPSRLVDTVNRSLYLAQWAREHAASAPSYARRDALHAALAARYRNEPIDYLEFGVWKGESILSWAGLNRHPESRLVGFDSFEGLPEDWRHTGDTLTAGTFSTAGRVPSSDDSRVSFVKGWFQQTLPGFLRGFRPRGRLIVHNDSDLYSSTLYVLATIHPWLVDDTVIIFDEFCDPLNEFRALCDYASAFGQSYDVLGVAGPYYEQVALRIRRPG